MLAVDPLVWHSQTTPLAALPVEQGKITRESRAGLSAGNRRFYERFDCRQTAAERLSRLAMRRCAGKRLQQAVFAAHGAATATRPGRGSSTVVMP